MTFSSAWREYLRRRPGLQRSDVDELEDHLRGSVDELVAVGLRADEASVSRRIGRDVAREAAAKQAAVGLEQQIDQGGLIEAAVRALIYVRLPEGQGVRPGTYCEPKMTSVGSQDTTGPMTREPNVRVSINSRFSMWSRSGKKGVPPPSTIGLTKSPNSSTRPSSMAWAASPAPPTDTTPSPGCC